MVKRIRNPTLFEKVILVIGLFVMVIGFVMIRELASNGGLDSGLLTIIFLWLILIMTIILVAVSEDVKEELRIIAEHQVGEVKMMSEETKLVKEEIKLLRADLGKKTKR